MVELVDTPALGAGGETHGGSSPLPGTMFDECGIFCYNIIVNLTNKNKNGFTKPKRFIRN
jgi:hypothetical protein